MFNKQPFNRGKFNRNILVGNRIFLSSEMDLSLDTATILNMAKALIAESTIELDIDAVLSRLSVITSENMPIHLSVEAHLSRTKPLGKDSPMSLNTTATLTRVRRLVVNPMLNLHAPATHQV